MIELFLTKERNLNDKTIEEVFPADFFNSNFWWYWSSMFAFEKWHSAMEMRRYIMRFIHHLGGLPDLSALKFTKYNQYESLILPLVTYLKNQGVEFYFATTIKNILFTENKAKEKKPQQIIFEKNNIEQQIQLTKDDFVFITNGSITESSTYGDHNTPAPITQDLGGSWELWKKLAEENKNFGKPEKFYANLPKESWFVSATVTIFDKKIAHYIEKISKRDPYAKKVVTGGIVTVTDSSWILSYTLNRQPHFESQSDDQLVAWVYGLLSNQKGDFVKKTSLNVQEWKLCKNDYIILVFLKKKFMTWLKTHVIQYQFTCLILHHILCQELLVIDH